MKAEWNQVTLEHVRQACQMHDSGTAKPKRPAQNTFLILDDKTYPAKFIRGLAHRLATGVELDPSQDYSGGMETVKFFQRLGLTTRHGSSSIFVAPVATPASPPLPSPQPAPSAPIASQRRPDPQKEAIAELLRRRFGTVEREAKFPWLIVPSPEQMDPAISVIYRAMQGMRGHTTFASFGKSLRCDFFVPAERLLIEYDERQHFTVQRAKSLELYPPNLALGYDKEEWLTACRTIKATDPMPPYRDEQRAFYDSLRDILAARNGVRLIRVRYGTFDWTSPGADERLSDLLASHQALAFQLADIPTTVEAGSPQGNKFGKVALVSDAQSLPGARDCCRPHQPSGQGNFLDSTSVPADARTSERECGGNAESSAFRVALVVPNYGFAQDDDKRFNISELQRACRAGEVDFLVFPEEYQCVEETAAQQTVDEWASFLKVPVLMGVKGGKFQLAVYRNPAPEDGDTQSHIYVKHATAEALAYEWPGYQGADDPMFQPIRLRGQSLGVQICHDMFYGLIGQRLLQRGSRVLIDLTSRNVKLRKWRNIVRGRSLEHKGHFLCTMGYDPQTISRGQGAAALAYRNGSPLQRLADTTLTNGAGGFVVFDLQEASPSGDEKDDQAFSSNVYTAITLSLGTGKAADVIVAIDKEQATITGPSPGNGWGNWRCFLTGAGKVGVLLLPLSRLDDGSSVHRLDAPDGMFDHHIILYYAIDAPAMLGSVLSLMKLRAIEHRAAVALLAGSCREVVKTTNYKDIQRFSESGGVFGLDGESLGGTWSTARGTDLGIPRRWFPSYLSLLQRDPEPPRPSR